MTAQEIIARDIEHQRIRSAAKGIRPVRRLQLIAAWVDHWAADRERAEADAVWNERSAEA